VRAGEVIEYFAELLSSAAPTGVRYEISTDEAIVESIAVVVRAHLRSGTGERP
jgi:hypothetical protein